MVPVRHFCRTCNGVSPKSVFRVGIAPFSSSSCTTFKWPLLAASYSGVIPKIIKNISVRNALNLDEVTIYNPEEINRQNMKYFTLDS